MPRFAQRTSKLGSLVSLCALSAMLMLFVANLPMFVGTEVGKVFAGIWLAFAVIMVISHTNRLLSAYGRQKTSRSPQGKAACIRGKKLAQVQVMRS